jgi:hypothetical protein
MVKETQFHLSDELRPRLRDGVTGAASTTAEGRSALAHRSESLLVQGLSLADYAILNELGRGGMGVVYQAYDRRRDSIVALKTLPFLEPTALVRFKNEFRALAGVAHPNLVPLFELVADGERWFFTMEFVEGVDFLEYVWASKVRPAILGLEHLRRLRETLAQLASGIQALHEAGKLHRDVKPSNTRVTPSGRAVLLDFGVVAELDRSGRHETGDGVVGTVAYMAPEQAAASPLSPASDWYSFGLLLYHALTGRLPFEGPELQVLRDKQDRAPSRPRALALDIPEDLDALCTALLDVRPECRPGAAEILQRLGAAPPESAPAPRPLFVGREDHLQALAEAYRAVLQGRQTTVQVEGRSGVGKTALVQHFLDDLRASGEAVVLFGKCYENESVPYMALDALVDSLSRFLKRLPEPEAEALLPRDVRPLARLFPVLLSVTAVKRYPARSAEFPDPRELRGRAFAALRELLARLGDRRTLVLAIDDLQWGDVDSAELLEALLRPPQPPLLLLVASFRTEDVERSPFLRAFLAPKNGEGGPARRIVVDPLTPAQTCDLALQLLGSDDAAARAMADAVARESGGNPFFAAELVQHLQSAGAEAAPPEGLSLAAAHGTPTAIAIDLRRRAAFQFLTSGHVDEGLGAVRLVVEAAGLSLGATPRRALVSLLARRLYLWFRGSGYKECGVGQVSPEELRLLDVTWGVSTGLGMIDPIRGSNFQAHNLILALRAGEPLWVARALSTEAAYLGITGDRGQARAARLLAEAEQITQRLPDPYTTGVLHVGRGMVHYCGERWGRSLQDCDRADEILQDHFAGGDRAFLLASARTFALWSLAQKGEVVELGKRLPGLIEEARQRGDLFALANYRSRPLALVHLGADDPAAARRDTREALGQWSQAGYHLQHMHGLLALVTTELYAGNGPGAWDLLGREWKLFQKSLLPRIKEFRIHMLQARAAAALAAAAATTKPRPLLREARHTARQLARERWPVAQAAETYTRGSLAAASSGTAHCLLERAAGDFARAEMPLHAAAVRRRLGMLLGGDQGAELIAAADAWMSARQIRNPSRMTDALAPPFPGIRWAD